VASNKGFAGYTMGGNASGTYTSSIHKLAFSSETSSTISAGIGVAAGRGGGYSNEGSSL
jgi:hypothetical protein